MPLLKGLILQDNYTLTHEQKEKTVTIIREYHNNRRCCRRKSIGTSRRYGYFHSICNTWRRRRCADNKEKKELL